MGCCLVLTADDFNMMEMMNRASRREHPAFEKVQYISRVNNPVSGLVEVLVVTEKDIARSLRQFFPEARASKGQQSHHVLPQIYKSFFNDKAGIDDINAYTVLLDQTSHLQMTHAREGYKNAWKAFVDVYEEQDLPQAEVKQAVIRYAGTLMTAFGFNDGDLNRHHQHGY